MVTFKGLNKFYVRANGQRHEMDVTELRAAFAGSEAVAERIRTFRDDRVGKILSGQSAIARFDGPILLMHVLPVGSAFDNTDLDPRTIDTKWLHLNRAGEASELVFAPADRPNLDGLLIYSPAYTRGVGGSPGFIKVFRNGGAEFAEGLYGFEEHQPVAATWVNGEETESRIFDALTNARDFRLTVSLGGPVIVSIALLRVNGLPFGTEMLIARFGRDRAFDRHVVILPDVLLDDEADLHDALRPMLDAMWQAAGSKGSPSYDQNGNYIRKRR